MKSKFLILILSQLLLLPCTLCAQKKFVINGKINSLSDGTKVFLNYTDTTKFETGIVKDGKFQIVGEISEPTFGSLSVRPDWTEKKGNMYTFLCIENGVISVSGDNLSDATITGGAVQTEYNRSGLNKLHLQKDAVMNPLAFEMQQDKLDTAKFSKLKAAYFPLKRKFNNARDNYVKKNGDSYVSLYYLYMRAENPNLDPFDTLFNVMSPRMKATKQGRKILSMVELAKNNPIGKKAHDFEQFDTAGRPVKLSSFAGKFVLLEFWASWCAPCRKEVPFLLEAYKGFDKKEFEIIGVSLDESKQMWRKAIVEDKLKWIQLSDLKKDNSAAKAFGVTGVPANFLINPEGVVIARDLRGESLNQKLYEFIKSDDEAAIKNKVIGKEFLKKNAAKEGVITLKSGLQYEILKSGNGKIPDEYNIMAANYTGKLLDGSTFANSNGKPISFMMDDMILGWKEALKIMPVGSKWKLYVPSELAYGKKGTEVVPANSVLIFELELLGTDTP